MNKTGSRVLCLRWGAWAAVWLALVLVRGPGFAAELDAHGVKARYIQSFIKYITWPTANSSTNFRVGVVGGPQVRAALEELLKGKDWQGKPFVVLNSESGSNGERDLIYISETNRERIAEAIAKAPREAVTIGEGPNFLSKGGMIEFNLSEGKIRFSVNLTAMRDAGFNVEAKLLSAAQEVRR